MQNFPWAIALSCLLLALVITVLGLWTLRRRRPASQGKLPTEWALAARSVFSTDERRIYRLLRESLPHHIVLSKLPLVRFCQPMDASEIRYWYDLLGSNYVTFAICGTNGRVLAAIDMDKDRSSGSASLRRVMRIKEAVLEACRVTYLRVPAGELPSAAELQSLVPKTSPAPAALAAPPAGGALSKARATLANTVASRRAERGGRWQDANGFQDSFFALDSRLDGFNGSDYMGLDEPASVPVDSTPVLTEQIDRPAPRHAGAGVVVEDRPRANPSARPG